MTRDPDPTDPAVRAVTRWNEEDAVSSETGTIAELQAEIDRTNQDLAALHEVAGQQELFFEAVWQSDMPDDRKAMWLYKAASDYWQQRDQLAAALRAVVAEHDELYQLAIIKRDWPSIAEARRVLKELEE